MSDVIGWLLEQLPGGDRVLDRPTPIEELTVGQVCDLLAYERRRWALLLIDDGVRDIRTLSEELASLESGTDYTEQERKAAYVALYQTHLPLLVEYDVLEEVDVYEYAPGPEFKGVFEAMVDLEYRVATSHQEVPDG